MCGEFRASLGYMESQRERRKEEERGERENDNLEKWLSMTLSAKPQLLIDMACVIQPLLMSLSPSPATH